MAPQFVRSLDRCLSNTAAKYDCKSAWPKRASDAGSGTGFDDPPPLLSKSNSACRSALLTTPSPLIVGHFCECGVGQVIVSFEGGRVGKRLHHGLNISSIYMAILVEVARQ